MMDGVIGRHHFCFAGFQRPDRLSWGALRTISQYDLAPGAERPATFHAGFEIVTIVLAGRWKRTGSLAGAAPLGPHEAGLVSAGIGVELGGRAGGSGNASVIEIWVTSRKQNREPRRQSIARRHPDLIRPIAMGAPAENDALMWESAARLHHGWLDQGSRFRSRLEYAELGYLVVVGGAVSVNGVIAQAGDGVAASGPGRLQLEALERSRLIWLQGL